jgi:hypothetical protein
MPSHHVGRAELFAPLSYGFSLVTREFARAKSTSTAITHSNRDKQVKFWTPWTPSRIYQEDN